MSKLIGTKSCIFEAYYLIILNNTLLELKPRRGLKFNLESLFNETDILFLNICIYTKLNFVLCFD